MKLEISKNKIIALLLITVFLKVHGETTQSWNNIINSIGFDIRPSYAFSSYKDDILKSKLDVSDARKTTLCSSLHFKYSFQFSPAVADGRLYPGVWQGIGTSVNFLGNHRGIGTPITVYVFQGAPIYKFNKRLSLFYEWNFGASFGWKKCDGEISYSNLIVGSKTNAYINLGAGLLWNLNSSYSMTAGIDLTHFSDGNTSFPNPGVNFIGLRIGVTRSLRSRFPEPGRKVSFDSDTLIGKKKLQFDVTAYGAVRKRVYRGGETPILLNGHFAVAGIDISPMWMISKIFKAGASADFQWDESTDLKRHHISGSSPEDICFSRPPFFNQISMGVSGRAELVMPIFSVNLGIGYNVFGPEETKASYQLANLKVRFTDHLYLNIGYQLLNFQRQNNLMLGVGYSFH